MIIVWKGLIILMQKNSKKADLLHGLLLKNGVNFSSGVPCGTIRHIIHNLENDDKIMHVPANRESEAVGIAAGAYLAGKTPVLYMQNSGFFAASNDIAALIIPYKMPILLMVSFRGVDGEDAPQHLVTGRATINLIDSFGMDYEIYQEQKIDELADRAFKTMRDTSLPFVLLLKRGWQNE